MFSSVFVNVGQWNRGKLEIEDWLAAECADHD